MASYSQEYMIEVLNYTRDNGVNRAEKHFGIPHTTINRWNKKFHIYTPQTAEYPQKKRKEILEYAAKHGVKAAAKHFGCSAAIIKKWNKELKVYIPPNRSFTREQKMEILSYARDYGVAAAADKYDIGTCLIVRWNNKMHVYHAQKTYTEKEKIEILTFAAKYGVAAAEKEFDLPGYTMLRWNDKYQIYTPKQLPDYTEYSESDRIKILKYAKQKYDELPPKTRSANYVFTLVSVEYNTTPDQLYNWNRKYRIVPMRSYTAQPLSQTEIDTAQSALTSARGRITRAARRSGLSKPTVKKLTDNKTISFKKATGGMKTNPPVGKRKSGTISEIISTLIKHKNNQGKDHL